MFFYDAVTGAPISREQFALPKNSQTTVHVGIECHDTYKFTCDSVSNITVEARLLGDTSWINIVTTPISLSAFVGLIKIFEVRFTVGAITLNERKIFSLRAQP